MILDREGRLVLVWGGGDFTETESSRTMALNVSSLKWESHVSLGKSFVLLDFQVFCLKEKESHLSCGWS